MLIAGLQKTTLIDYPGKVACTVFTAGCNFRCGYCHNPELQNISNLKNQINKSDFLSFLNLKKGKLDGVVITGGEPTIHRDLEELIVNIKDLGFLVKLDTQGSNPDTLEILLSKNLLDYVAMDVKAPIQRYYEFSKQIDIQTRIKSSIRLLLNSDIDYEFRTTIVKENLSPNDILEIGKSIKGADKYFLQKFEPTKTLDPAYMQYNSYTDVELETLVEELKPLVKSCHIRY